MTAKQRVLARLRAADGAWVRGVDLADAGGYRFGARVYELRRDGYAIPDPRSAVDLYRLVEKPRQLTMDDAEGTTF